MTGRVVVDAAPDVRDPDAGMTLVEVLVAIGLFGVLGSLLLGFAFSTSRVTDDTRHIAGLSEESRLAMERLTRELRQAGVVTAVHLPSGPTDTTALTFGVDFDGNRFIDPDAADPELLTYRWNPVTQRLTLTANDPDGTSVTRPVLAGHVTSFVLSLRSSLWQYDANANGTTWQELDAAGPPVGNADGALDGPELAHIDSVGISLVVADGTHLQSYSTVVDLRNLNLS